MKYKYWTKTAQHCPDCGRKGLYHINENRLSNSEALLHCRFCSWNGQVGECSVRKAIDLKECKCKINDKGQGCTCEKINPLDEFPEVSSAYANCIEIKGS